MVFTSTFDVLTIMAERVYQGLYKNSEDRATLLDQFALLGVLKGVISGPTLFVIFINDFLMT